MSHKKLIEEVKQLEKYDAHRAKLADEAWARYRAIFGEVAYSELKVPTKVWDGFEWLMENRDAVERALRIAETLQEVEMKKLTEEYP